MSIEAQAQSMRSKIALCILDQKVEIEKWRKEAKVILVGKEAHHLIKECCLEWFMPYYLDDSCILGKFMGLTVIEVESLSNDELLKVY